MTGKAVTRADLAEAVRQPLGFSRAESAELVRQVIEEICATLAAGETVKLSGFGLFAVRNKNKRMARNPKTGEPAPVTPRRVVAFSASPVLRAHINDGSKPR